MESNHSALALVSVSPEDAAHLIGLGRTKVFELIRTGELPAAKVGRRTLIPVSGLHALIGRLTKQEAA
jgi:excisionase family DNA binding protein